MRPLGVIGIALGLGSAVVLTDLVIEQGSSSRQVVHLFGMDVFLPLWAIVALIGVLGALVVLLLVVGFQLLRRNERRARLEEEIAGLEERRNELEAMHRVLEQLNEEVAAELEGRRVKKYVLAAGKIHNRIALAQLDRSGLDDLARPDGPRKRGSRASRTG